MNLPRETQPLSKNLDFSAFEKPSSKASTQPAKRGSENLEQGDSASKKRKLLEDKAPGLLEHLSKYAQEEASTEAASMHSPDKESDEHRHSIHIPMPFREMGLTDITNLSSTVKADSQKMGQEILPLPRISSEGSVSGSMGSSGKNFEIEEIQRQKILNFITFNTLLLNNVMNQQRNCQRTLFSCIENFGSLKDRMSDSQKTHIEKIEQIKKEKGQTGAFDSNPTSSILFNHLFGTKNQYKYELVLDNEIPTPIFRERNLVIKVKLVDILTKEIMRNENKILLHLGLQTWEVPSNPILRNKTGNRAIMGETEIELEEGTAVFDRIQINEVTSKFIHGYVAMLVIPTKPVNYGTSLKDQEREENCIQYEEIKPLMLEKIIVKSKKKNLLKKKSEKN